jgi:hypothetical protein
MLFVAFLAKQCFEREEELLAAIDGNNVHRDSTFVNAFLSFYHKYFYLES